MERELRVALKIPRIGLSEKEKMTGYRELEKYAQEQGVRITNKNFYCTKRGGEIVYVFCGEVM
jgi:hypothetical protein